MCIIAFSVGVILKKVASVQSLNFDKEMNTIEWREFFEQKVNSNSNYGSNVPEEWSISGCIRQYFERDLREEEFETKVTERREIAFSDKLILSFSFWFQSIFMLSLFTSTTTPTRSEWMLHSMRWWGIFHTATSILESVIGDLCTKLLPHVSSVFSCLRQQQLGLSNSGRMRDYTILCLQKWQQLTLDNVLHEWRFTIISICWWKERIALPWPNEYEFSRITPTGKRFCKSISAVL